MRLEDLLEHINDVQEITVLVRYRGETFERQAIAGYWKTKVMFSTMSVRSIGSNREGLVVEVHEGDEDEDD